jgi:hypothetical protein
LLVSRADDYSERIGNVIGRALVVAYALLGAAVFMDDGGLGPLSLPLAVTACVLVARAIVRAPAPVARFGAPEVVAVVLVVDAALVWIKSPGVYLQGSGLVARALITMTALGAAWAAVTSRRVSGWFVAAVIVLVGVAAILVIQDSPTPKIDVFTLQQEGARDLWSGLDPYRSVFTNPYSLEETLVYYGAPFRELSHYPYPPMSLLFSAAGWRLTGDVRYAFLAAQLATGAALYALARRHGLRSGLAVACAALLLVHPRGLFVLEQAWTEPLLGAAFVFALLLLDAPRQLAFGVALAVLLAAKQYSPLLLPMFLAPRFSARRVPVGFALLGVASVTLPFVIWDYEAFIDDVIMLHVHQPFRWGSLSIAPVIAFISGWQPSVLAPLAAVASMAWSWRRVPPGPHGLCLVASLTLMAFFITAKQAFCNYYYFAGVVVLCAAITTPPTAEQRRDRPAE